MLGHGGGTQRQRGSDLTTICSASNKATQSAAAKRAAKQGLPALTDGGLGGFDDRLSFEYRVEPAPGSVTRPSPGRFK